jgi:endonuclease/exonuclease/phosphatase family metal-dependent hydrolase
MKKPLIFFFKTIALIIVLLLLLFGGFMVYITITDYKHAAIEILEIKGNNRDSIIKQREFTLMTWNIGYCGLGKEMDFFYEGGKQVRPDFEKYQNYRNGIMNFISNNDTVDFWLFQEVDKNSKRSYYTDQENLIVEKLYSYDYVFGKNYDVKFVPVPLTSPMGKVVAGIMGFSVFRPEQAYKYAYPDISSWPKNLVIINTHNSYYVQDDSLRLLELNVLKNRILSEYESGTYVVVGGDWNKLPPGFNKENNLITEPVQNTVKSISRNFLPEDWCWAYDDKHPTNRALNKKYKKGNTSISIIDFFVVSPNIEVIEVKTIPLGFENSDHHPVYLKIRLI